MPADCSLAQTFLLFHLNLNNSIAFDTKRKLFSMISDLYLEKHISISNLLYNVGTAYARKKAYLRVSSYHDIFLSNLSSRNYDNILSLAETS